MVQQRSTDGSVRALITRCKRRACQSVMYRIRFMNKPLNPNLRFFLRCPQSLPTIVMTYTLQQKLRGLLQPRAAETQTVPKHSCTKT